MQLQLVSRKLSVPFCGELDVFVSAPAVQPVPENKNKTPLSLYVSNDGASAPMGCYVYSIPGPAGIYSTLLNNSDESLVDLTEKLSKLISKKYNSPTYVNVNGAFRIEEFTPVIRALIAAIDECFQ